jgi:hypothetical protein
MKTLKRKIGTILVGCFVFNAIFSLSLPVQASSENTVAVAEYNLKEGGTQKFEIIDAQGEAVKVTITEMKKTSRISNGSYNVEFSKPLSWQAGFYVDIKNNQITSAYSPYYKVQRGAILFPSLIKENSKQATFYFTYKITSQCLNKGVRAQISGSNLNVFDI